LKNMVRPGGLELPTFWFVARRSIQLSYGRVSKILAQRVASLPRNHIAYLIEAPTLDGAIQIAPQTSLAQDFQVPYGIYPSASTLPRALD
jgi:hypothetical protein